MKYFYVLTLLFYLTACSSSEKSISQSAAEDNSEDTITDTGTASSSSETDLDKYRTQLSDAYTYRENKIPEGFNRIKVQKEEQKNLYEGYRIQIYSGEDVVQADTMAANFRAWADTTITGYQPDTYVFFRTPYYRVHVGDFHERERAIQFSNIVKRYFRGAWVVYDRVNPEKVPADTTTIQSQ